jgi:hypothetical protein
LALHTLHKGFKDATRGEPPGFDARRTSAGPKRTNKAKLKWPDQIMELPTILQYSVGHHHIFARVLNSAMGGPLRSASNVPPDDGASTRVLNPTRHPSASKGPNCLKWEAFATKAACRFNVLEAHFNPCAITPGRHRRVDGT